MLKVFYKSYSTAPFLQEKITTPEIHKNYLNAIYILACFSLFNYGFSFFLHAISAYILALAFVWFSHIFQKTMFFSTAQWKISVWTYVFMLSPDISIIQNLFGVFILFTLGCVILLIFHKPIINPILLGILATSFTKINYIDHIFIPFPYIILKLFTKDNNLENFDSIKQFFFSLPSFTDKPNFISFLSNYNFEFFHQTLSWNEFIISTQSPWFGAGSILILLILFIFLTFSQTILALPSILFYITYIVFHTILYTYYNITISFNELFLNPALWFSSIFLMSNSLTLPQSKYGSYFISILAGIIVTLLNIRSSHSSINFVYTFILVNIISNFIDYITTNSILGSHKKGLTNTTTEDFDKINSLFSKSYLIRIFIGITMIFIAIFCSKIFSQNTLNERKDSYYNSLITRIFPQEGVLSLHPYPNIYRLQKLNELEKIVIHSSASFDRSQVELLVLLEDSLIKDIKITLLETAHTYYHNTQGIEFLVDTSILNITDTLKNSDSQFKSYNPIVTKTIHQALIIAQKTYTDYLANKEGL